MTTNWTTQQIPDLTNKVIIITGANSGIGFEAAKEFTRKGATTILACRNLEKAESALQKIRKEVPSSNTTVMELDLASLKSIQKFADTFKANYRQLDILLNNAGIMMVPYGKTEDGFESHFGTNHLGHFALTGLLVTHLLSTPGSRVVNVSSKAHTFGNIDFNNLQFEGGKEYSPISAYARSKLANLLFTMELQHRLKNSGSDTIATAAHPGLSNTPLADHILLAKIARPVYGLFIQNAAMGVLPSLRAAIDPQAKGGEYFGPDGHNQSKGYPMVVDASKASSNSEDALKLWRISEELTGIKFL